MKSIILIGLLAFFSATRVFNETFYDKLRKEADWEFFEPEENPFRDWTDEEI